MKIAAALATPVCVGGKSALPEGTELRGEVKRVSKVGLGLIHESAALQLQFTELVVPDGRAYTVSTRLAGIDNARERVGRDGKIHGIRATATLSNRFAERIAFAALGHPVVMIPLFVAESSLFHFPDPEIEFRRGTVIQLQVDFPAQFGEVDACPLPEVDMLPYWAYSKRQRQPMDLVNLLFVGSRDELDRAFAVAEWTGSQSNTMRSEVAAIRAIAEDRNYSDAPMRTLLLDGQEPDIRLQKSLDTFEKRDHLRIWSRDDELDGRPVWASAATRDVGTTFGMHPFGFTHEVQADLDLERDKVVHDLIFTGCVSSVAYIQRPEGVRETGQRYRKGVITDARVAVVSLNNCLKLSDTSATREQLPGPGRAARLTRRVTLTARNHLLRDNLIYRTADAVRLAYLALREFDRQARQEGQARRLEIAAHRPPTMAWIPCPE